METIATRIETRPGGDEDTVLRETALLEAVGVASELIDLLRTTERIRGACGIGVTSELLADGLEPRLTGVENAMLEAAHARALRVDPSRPQTLEGELFLPNLESRANGVLEDIQAAVSEARRAGELVARAQVADPCSRDRLIEAERLRDIARRSDEPLASQCVEVAHALEWEPQAAAQTLERSSVLSTDSQLRTRIERLATVCPNEPLRLELMPNDPPRAHPSAHAGYPSGDAGR